MNRGVFPVCAESLILPPVLHPDLELRFPFLLPSSHKRPYLSGSLWPPAVCALEMKNLPSALTSCWDRDFRLLGFTSMVFCLWVLV